MIPRPLSVVCRLVPTLAVLFLLSPPKSLQFGRTRLQVTAGAYNLLNSSAVFAVNTAYGAAWREPTIVMEGRLIKFGFQVDY